MKVKKFLRRYKAENTKRMREARRVERGSRANEKRTRWKVL